MSSETRYISLTQEELARFGETCAKMAVDRAMDELQEEFRSLYTSLQLVKGIVSREDLALMFDKDPKTIKRWARRHDFEHVDGPDQRKIYYGMEDIKKKVQGSLR